MNLKWFVKTSLKWVGRLASNQFLPPTQSSCNPATGGQGYWDGAGNPGLYSLVVIEMASHCNGSWRRVESWPHRTVALHKGRVVQGTGSYLPGSELKGSQCKKLPFQCSPGRYKGSQSDCILLDTNGHSSYNCWMFKYTHKVSNCTKSGRREKGKTVGQQPWPVKTTII